MPWKKRKAGTQTEGIHTDSKSKENLKLAPVCKQQSSSNFSGMYSKNFPKKKGTKPEYTQSK